MSILLFRKPEGQYFDSVELGTLYNYCKSKTIENIYVRNTEQAAIFLKFIEKKPVEYQTMLDDIIKKVRTGKRYRLRQRKIS